MLFPHFLSRSAHISSKTFQNRVRSGLENRVEVIERIVRASLHARDSRWSLHERRDNVRRSFANPQRLRLVYDQAIMVGVAYS